MDVDHYVNTQVLPQYRATVAIVRAAVRECAPASIEEFSYNMPVFKAGDKTFAWLLGTKKDITFSFREGILFKDKFKLLRGTGKHARHIKLKGADTVDVDVLRYYIEQAIALDAKLA